MRPSFTVKELEDWQLHGATWRAKELTHDHAVIELCSCTGEPMDLVESDLPELIEYIRAHRDDELL